MGEENEGMEGKMKGNGRVEEEAKAKDWTQSLRMNGRGAKIDREAEVVHVL